MDPGLGGMPLFFKIALAVMAVLLLLGVTMVVTVARRSRKVLKEAGLDPLAAEAQLAVRLAQGPLMAKSRTVEERLAELDDLHRRGRINDEELATARAAVLADG